MLVKTSRIQATPLPVNSL